MAKKKIVTNAMRMLDKAKIAFDTVEYETDGEIGENFGIETAAKIGIPPEQSFKTLVVRGEKNGIIVCCVPVNREVDLKKLAVSCGDKRVELIHVKELLSLTGYIRGGVSPIGMKKKYPVYLDISCTAYDRIAVSAGICGCTLIMACEDVIRVTDAAVCDITKAVEGKEQV